MIISIIMSPNMNANSESHEAESEMGELDTYLSPHTNLNGNFSHCKGRIQQQGE